MRVCAFIFHSKRISGVMLQRKFFVNGKYATLNIARGVSKGVSHSKFNVHGTEKCC